jgi:tRNA-(ms[2]io[6]A)-hydroxylase
MTASSLLRAETPDAWVEAARRSREVLLIDHANCEKKAASTALALMFAYAEDTGLTLSLSRLAREELRHYEQVVRLIERLGIKLERLSPGRYAEQLRRPVARAEPERGVDLMLCGAFIEARSCERFARLSRSLEGPVAALFAGLEAAEARHQELYLELAHRAAEAAGLDLAPRIERFARLEAELITSPDPLFRFHSGAPAEAPAAGAGALC